MSQLLSIPQDEKRNASMVQQPRRFACDRCRTQKLRCERDTWRPSLMPCKRCRKAQMKCTISSALDRSTSRRSKPTTDIEARERKGKYVFTDKSEDIVPQPGLFPEPSSDVIPPAFHESSPEDLRPDILASASHGRPVSFDSVIGQTQSDVLLDNEDYRQTVDLEHLIDPFFSGLITPPSLDGDGAYQAPIQGPHASSHHQRWTALGNAEACHDVIDWEPSAGFLHDSGDDEKHYQYEYCGRLLEFNLQLLHLQRRVSEKLSNQRQSLSPTQPLSNLAALQSAVQDVLKYSVPFMEILKGAIVSNRLAATSQSVPTVSTVTPPLLTTSRSVHQNRNIQTPAFFSTPRSEHQPDQHNDGYCVSDCEGEVDLPILFAVMNCYACVFGIYSTILFRLQQHIIFSPLSDDQLSANLMGYHPTTALTESHREYLQLRFIFGESVHMLAQLETCLGVPEQYCVAAAVVSGSEDGPLSNSVAAALLDALAGQGYGTCGGSDVTNDGAPYSLKEIIQTINQYFKMF